MEENQAITSKKPLNKTEIITALCEAIDYSKSGEMLVKGLLHSPFRAIMMSSCRMTR